MAGELLARALLKGMTDNPDNTDIVFGTVTSISPLKVKVNNQLE